MIRILHLTDFHLNTRTLKDWNDFLKEAFFKKLDEIKKEKKIDLVLFTGDMIDQAGKEFGSVDAGLQSFKENIIQPILLALELDISRFIICPGNHDINRNADKSFYESGLKSELNSIEAINNFINSDENDFDGIQRIKDYKKFEFDLYKAISDKLHTKFKFSIILDINGKSVGVSSINSSWRCYGDDDYKNLLVGENQLNDNFLFVKNCDLKIALMHHQLDWLSEIELKTIKSHISKKYDLVFSGHIHETEVEHVHNLAGTSFRVVSPSGLNQIRQKESDYINGFSVIDYGENIKCHFLKYNSNQEIFVDNTDACDHGIKEFNLNTLPAIADEKKVSNLLDDEFLEFLNDSGANFTHRGKTLTLNDIYVAPFMEQFNLIEEEEKGTSVRSQDILKRIVSREIKHVVILGEENSGKTSFCKQIYKDSIVEDKTISVFIKGRDIKKVTIKDIENQIDKEFRKQYKETFDFKKYNVLVIIDDLNNCRLPKKSIKTFLNNLHQIQIQIQTVITWDEFFTFSELIESQVTNVEIYEILKFGGRKRVELIRKWVDLMDDEFENDQAKEFQIKELSKIINSVIGKNLIPSLPVYILTILQANELNNTTNFEQSTFGHYYDVLIKSALGQIIKANSEIEKYYSYLTEFSFWLFNNKTIEIDENDLIKFHNFFVDKYRVQQSFRDSLSILETSNLIQKNLDLYKFKYKYIYFYFIGKYFSDNIENDKVQEIVTDLSNKLYQTDAANIYIFLSHHSKSRFIINQIIERAKELFADELIIGFNTDVEKINELIQETAKKMDLVVETSSNYDQDHNEELSIEQEIYEEDHKNEEIDSISQVNKAFKTIEILGYILKNRYASLTGVDKIELVEELYKLGLRSLTFLFNTFIDGEEYIKNEIIDLIKKDPNSALTMREREELAKQFMFNLLYMVSYSIFKRISSSISSKDLEMTFNDVKKKLFISPQSTEKNNAISLIDIAVVFEYSKSFPTKRVNDLAKDFKGNHLAFNILRRLGLNFMRMIPMKEQDQQSASEILDISVNKQRVIVGTSSIKKIK